MKDNDIKENSDDEITPDIDAHDNAGYNDEYEEEIESEEDAAASDISKLKKKLQECRRERQEYMDGWQRAQADYTNLKKELEQEKNQAKRNAKIDTLSAILPALDSFELAFSNKEAWEAVDKNWRVGMENIYAQLLDALKSSGIHQINPESDEFDPNIHESIETVHIDSDESDGIIAEVIQKGYITDDSVVRPAKVKVYRANTTDE